MKMEEVWEKISVGVLAAPIHYARGRGELWE